jgi:hypothetical protein
MDEEINLSYFNKLSLEERTQIALRNYFWTDKKDNVSLKNDVIDLFKFKPLLEAWAHAERSNYVEIVGGTPKSGASYNITKEGLEFMDKTL